LLQFDNPVKEAIFRAVIKLSVVHQSGNDICDKTLCLTELKTIKTLKIIVVMLELGNRLVNCRIPSGKGPVWTLRCAMVQVLRKN
jgi:hypothetical protein